MIRQIISLPLRIDAAGDGSYGAKRGDRAHTGIDYECHPGRPVLSPCRGTVEKLGFAYADDMQWRIVDIRATDGFLHRCFYVAPTVGVGDLVIENTPIGVAQDISKRYPNRGMKPHIHHEIKDQDGHHVNPETLKPSNI